LHALAFLSNKAGFLFAKTLSHGEIWSAPHMQGHKCGKATNKTRRYSAVKKTLLICRVEKISAPAAKIAYAARSVFDLRFI